VAACKYSDVHVALVHHCLDEHFENECIFTVCIGFVACEVTLAEEEERRNVLFSSHSLTLLTVLSAAAGQEKNTYIS